MPVDVPQGVEITLDGHHLRVKGPKGELFLDAHPEMDVTFEDAQLANMVQGVSEGFEKSLEIIGVGYRAEKQGQGIKLSLGFSHTIQYDAPEGVEIEVPALTQIIVRGADKQKVGQAAAEIRAFRPPEPYKGKGVRYKGEHVRRKAGKTAVGGIGA